MSEKLSLNTRSHDPYLQASMFDSVYDMNQRKWAIDAKQLLTAKMDVGRIATQENTDWQILIHPKLLFLYTI